MNFQILGRGVQAVLHFCYIYLTKDEYLYITAKKIEKNCLFFIPYTIDVPFARNKSAFPLFRISIKLNRILIISLQFCIKKASNPLIIYSYVIHDCNDHVLHELRV